MPASPALLRSIALPVVAVAAIVAQADVRLAIGLPGHRGLLWLTVLAVVAYTARTRGTTTAVGAASALLLAGLGATPVDALRYAAAAALLDAALALPAVRRLPVLLAVLAGPIHLVALATPLLRGMPLGDRPLLHLAFGLAAGLIAWAITRGTCDGSPTARPTTGVPG